MSVQYLEDFGSKRKHFGLIITLTRWRGSLYKLVWIDLLVYLLVYYFFNLIYRFALRTDVQKQCFEEIVRFCDSMKSNIPISFLLGFYVSGVIARWFQLYLQIPWLYKLAFIVEGMVNGGDKEKCRKIRQTVLRYLNLAWILCLRKVSDQIEIRFRQKDGETAEAGIRETLKSFNRDRKIQTTYRKIITDAEIRAFENIAAKTYSTVKEKYNMEYWVPIQWSSRLMQKAYLHGYISDIRTLNSLIGELDELRGQMQSLQVFSGIMIPLVYTQVIIIAVYSYFLCQMFASQFVTPKTPMKGHEVDLYVPIFTIFQFLFFMGWLKVALCVMNPFGDDDEDFQTSEILDYNLVTTYRSVTADLTMYPEHLEPPTACYGEPKESQQKDIIDSFICEVDEELEEIEQQNDNNVENLVLQPNRFYQFISLITCGKFNMGRQNFTSPLSAKTTTKSLRFFHNKTPRDQTKSEFEESEGFKPENQKENLMV